MELTKERIEALLRIEEDMKKILEKKRVEDMDTIEREKWEKQKKEILDAITAKEKGIQIVNKLPEKPIAGMEYLTNDDESFAKFLWMVKQNDTRLKTAMSTTSAQGGYTIPEEWAKDIVNSLNNFAASLTKVTTITMTDPTLHIQSLLTDLSVAWSTEATAKSTTKPTFSQADLTLRFLYALITATKELTQDTLLNLAQFLKNLVAENMALELEAQILQANAAPFTGILNAAGVNAVAQAGVSLAYSDLTAVVNNTGQLEQYKTGAEWWMTRGAVDIIGNLMDNNNRPLLNLNNTLNDAQMKASKNNLAMSLLGYPVYISDQITDTTGAGGTTNIAFGNLKHVWMGKKKGHEEMDVLWTNVGVIDDGAGAVSENALTQNKEIWRFELRRGTLVTIPAAYVKLTGVK